MLQRRLINEVVPILCGRDLIDPLVVGLSVLYVDDPLRAGKHDWLSSVTDESPSSPQRRQRLF